MKCLWHYLCITCQTKKNHPNQFINWRSNRVTNIQSNWVLKFVVKLLKMIQTKLQVLVNQITCHPCSLVYYYVQLRTCLLMSRQAELIYVYLKLFKTCKGLSRQNRDDACSQCTNRFFTIHLLKFHSTKESCRFVSGFPYKTQLFTWLLKSFSERIAFKNKKSRSRVL